MAVEGAAGKDHDARTAPISRERVNLASRPSGSVQGQVLRAARTKLALRILTELVLWIGVGLFMAYIGPYGSERQPISLRYPYWLACMVGGAAIGVALDETLGRKISTFWLRLLAVSLIMTPAVVVLVYSVGKWIFGSRLPTHLPNLIWQVFLICVVVMALRILAWRAPKIETITRTITAPPLPEAEAAFRRRLSAKRRGARLIALEAHDHYLRVHTELGVELLTLRLTDALEELKGAGGLRIHRSWWVSQDAILAVRWKRGGGELSLTGDLSAPVSRTYVNDLKACGWF